MDYPLRGLTGITVYWRDLITNILPRESDGILISFENECSPTFTFQVNGPDVDYLGRGYFHDDRYEEMATGVSCPKQWNNNHENTLTELHPFRTPTGLVARAKQVFCRAESVYRYTGCQ
jgi:hypothetical protein